jgi:hypothetical protein
LIVRHAKASARCSTRRSSISTWDSSAIAGPRATHGTRPSTCPPAHRDQHADAAAIEPDQARWPQAGDQLCRPRPEHRQPAGREPSGDRAAAIEISETPHTGCAKFSARFGSEALRWVNGSTGRLHRLRGLNARVVTAGTIRVGDSIRKV